MGLSKSPKPSNGVSTKWVSIFCIASFLLGVLVVNRFWAIPDPSVVDKQASFVKEYQSKVSHPVVNCEKKETSVQARDILSQVSQTHDVIMKLDKTISSLEMQLAAARSLNADGGEGSPIGTKSGTEPFKERQKVFFVMGIITAFSSRKRRDSIRETWMAKGEELKKLETEKGIILRFVIGHSASPGGVLDRAIDAEEELHNDFLRLNHIEGYHELSSKTQIYFSTAVARWDADFYVKVDDDVHVNLGMVGSTLACHRSKPRVYIGCMKSGPVLSQKGVKYHEPEHWKFGEEGNKYFRHATGQIYAISKDLATYISVNRHKLHRYANEDVSLGSWFIGLDVEHIDERGLCCGTPPGWTWKPKWANLGRELFDSSVPEDSANTAPSPASSSIPSSNSLKFQLPSCFSWIANVGIEKDSSFVTSALPANCSSTQLQKESSSIVYEGDLEHLCKLVEEKDGGPAWVQMMDRSTPTMGYKAWRRDPESGPPQYRSSTIFEDATPEMVRDFFWDDEFRLKWDDMLIYAKTLDECPATGTMMVHWVRKFPFFCSDREYIMGRRIWESGRLYYCITKGVPCSSVPLRNKPRRVELYYSSWCIRAVKSKRGDGQLTACEVLLFHHEDMGIPWEIAKLGVRQGMWGAVKKIEPGLRSYQKHRAAGDPLSGCAFMAQINTKVSADYLRSLESNTSCLSEVKTQDSFKKQGGNIPRMLVVGGAIALACTLDKELLTKAIIFGVARRFANIGRRM